ncbi:putative reverse transcriptase-like protein, partial [Dinothrombium tinctorium]
MSFCFILGIDIGRAFPLVIDLEKRTISLKHTKSEFKPSGQRPRSFGPKRQLAAHITHFSTRGEIDKLIEEHKDVFDTKNELPGCYTDDYFRIRLKTDKLVAKRPYRHPQAKREEKNRHADELLEQGYIRKSTSLFASPGKHVGKKDGSQRMVFDLTQDISANTAELNRIRMIAKRNSDNFKERKRIEFDKSRKSIVSKPGTLVKRKIPKNLTTRNKLSPSFDGPYEILKQTSPVNFRLKKLQTGQEEIAHACHLEPYYPQGP